MKRLLPLLYIGTCACQAVLAPAHPSWPPLPNAQFMHVGGYLQVTGVGRGAKPAANETQARSEARDAAILDAWTRLKAYIDALPLDGGRSVAGVERENEGLAKAVERLVYSAQIVSTRWDGPEAAVVVRIDKDSVNQLLGTDFK